MSTKIDSLKIPASVEESGDGVELLRFWVSQNAEQMSLRVGAMGDAEKEPAMWGFILADIARHVMTIMREQNPEGPDAQKLLETMMTGFAERMKANPVLPQNVKERKE
jgi:hypothetical protein